MFTADNRTEGQLILSPLAHAWFIDLDGTLLVHNGHKSPSGDMLVDGALEFMESIPEDDVIVIATSRTEEYRDVTIRFLQANGIRYDHILFNRPYGERIVVNDMKPSGLKTALAVNLQRDGGMPNSLISIDNAL